MFFLYAYLAVVIMCYCIIAGFIYLAIKTKGEVVVTRLQVLQMGAISLIPIFNLVIAFYGVAELFAASGRFTGFWDKKIGERD